MDIFISHESALEYWRLRGKARDKNEHVLRRKKPPVSPPHPSAFQTSKIQALSLPIDIIVGSPNARRPLPEVRFNVCSSPLPDGSLIGVGDGLIVSSPEFCFFQMASRLSLIKLVELGFELCGSYLLPSRNPLIAEGEINDVSDDKGIYNCKPLTNTKKLSTFVARMAGTHGYKRASRALRFIADNSASPMETILVMLLSLPYKLGGYGLPTPQLNSHIIPGKTIKRNASKTFYSCDLFWPDLNLAVEYDSDQFHTGADRIASDSKRRNALISAGIVVITVTRQQIRNAIEFEKAAKLLASNMDKRLRYKNPGFAKAQRELRSQLL